MQVFPYSIRKKGLICMDCSYRFHSIECGFFALCWYKKTPELVTIQRRNEAIKVGQINICTERCNTSSVLIGLHSSVVRTLDLKTRGCGFDSRTGQPYNYYLSFG